MNCHYKKCENKAIGRLSPDLDIEGLGFCKEHEEQVKYEYYQLISGNKD